MMRYTFSVLLVLIQTFFYTSSHAVALGDGEELDSIVAIVNDSVIVRSELQHEIDSITKRIRASGKLLPPKATVEKQVLEQLILRKLQLDKAEKIGINISPDMLATAIGNIARKNGMTLSELRQTLGKDGVDFRTFRRKLKDEITLSRLKSLEIINKIQVSDAEIDSFLKNNADVVNKSTEYHILHILIATPDQPTAKELEKARNKAEELRLKIQQGADFSKLATTNSDGRKALEGGDLGWFKSNDLPSLFNQVVPSMKKGDISKPLRSPSGYHLIMLADIRGDSKAYVTQTKVRHILISTGEMVSDNDAKTRLEQLKIRLEGGDDFATLARSHSDDKISAIKGGDLGWVTPESLVPKFVEQMDKLQPGELSEPFRTRYGWHLIQVLDRRQHDNSEQLKRSQAEKIIKKRKTREATELYLRRLRDEAYVEIHLEEE